MINWTDQRRLVAIHTVSGFAVWLDIFLIFSVPAFYWKAQPQEIAFIAACLGVPGLIFGPIAGALVDRLDVRRSILIGASLRTILSIAIVFSPNITVFAIIVLMKGFANLVYFPAAAVINNRLIPIEDRLAFYSMLSMADQIAKVLIPLMAGFVAILISSRQLFFVSAGATAVTYAIAWTVIQHLPAPSSPAVLSIRKVYSDVLVGFLAFRTLSADLKIGIFLSAGTSLTLALYDPLLAAYLAYRGFDLRLFAAIMASTAVGAIASASLVRWKYREADPIKLRLVGLGVFVAALVLVTLILPNISNRPLYIVSPLVWVINGFGYEMFVLSTNVVTQNLTPREMVGRITTSIRSLQMVCVIGGPVIGALIIFYGSRDAPFYVAAVVGSLLFLVAYGMHQSALRFNLAHSDAKKTNR